MTSGQRAKPGKARERRVWGAEATKERAEGRWGRRRSPAKAAFEEARWEPCLNPSLGLGILKNRGIESRIRLEKLLC